MNCPYGFDGTRLNAMRDNERLIETRRNSIRAELAKETTMVDLNFWRSVKVDGYRVTVRVDLRRTRRFCIFAYEPNTRSFCMVFRNNRRLNIRAHCLAICSYFAAVVRFRAILRRLENLIFLLVRWRNGVQRYEANWLEFESNVRNIENRGCGDLIA